MRMVLLRIAVLVAIGTWFWSTDVSGQSMSKNLTGPAVKIENMSSNTSSKWKEAKAQKPALYKFIMPKSTSKEPYDGEVTVQLQEGKTDEILGDLKKKFSPTDDEKKLWKSDKAKVGSGNVVVADVRGTFDDDGKKVEKYRMIAAVLEVKDKKYLIRAQGPMNTVNYHRSDFLAWVAAFK